MYRSCSSCWTPLSSGAERVTAVEQGPHRRHGRPLVVLGPVLGVEGHRARLDEALRTRPASSKHQNGARRRRSTGSRRPGEDRRTPTAPEQPLAERPRRSSRGRRRHTHRGPRSIASHVVSSRGSSCPTRRCGPGARPRLGKGRPTNDTSAQPSNDTPTCGAGRRHRHLGGATQVHTSEQSGRPRRSISQPRSVVKPWPHGRLVPGRAQRPVNRAGRFSMNAATPPGSPAYGTAAGVGGTRGERSARRSRSPRRASCA